MTGNLPVLIALVIAALVLLSPWLRRSAEWRATVTPLASIIGSGFLVSVPLLARETGNWAILAMAVLVLASYLTGAAIRYNIAHVEPLLAKDTPGPHLAVGIERLSHFVLAFAYFISVAYYLVLLGNFLLTGIGLANPAIWAKIVATLILAALGLLGLLRGLTQLEKIEEYAVGINLAVIVALLVGLVLYNAHAIGAGSWHLAPLSPDGGGHMLRVVLGLLIVVQGFETSRFIGDEFDAPTRIRTMRRAQIIAGAIYLIFFALVTLLFGDLGSDSGVAAIVGLVGHVAPILPVILVISAVASQFSASVADSVGAAGLLEGISRGRLSPQHSYPIIALIAILLTWETDVFRLITLASQAFALFYLLQCGVALLLSWRNETGPARRRHLLTFGAAGLFCLCVTLLGIPAGA